jgi:hypothetical protein
MFVAGPSGPLDAVAADKAGDILDTLFHLDLIESSSDPHRVHTDDNLPQDTRKPRNVEEAVDWLMESLSLREKTQIARSTGDETSALHYYLGEHIRNELRWWEGNPDLLEACQRMGDGENSGDTRDASAYIIDRFIDKIKSTHNLRVVSPDD